MTNSELMKLLVEEGLNSLATKGMAHLIGEYRMTEQELEIIDKVNSVTDADGNLRVDLTSWVQSVGSQSTPNHIGTDRR